MKKRYISWDEYFDLINRLNKQIKCWDRIHCIKGIQRGGLIPAVMLSHLRNKSLVAVCPIPDGSFRDAIPSLKLREDNSGSSLYLIVDDISDTGKTLACVTNEHSYEGHYDCGYLTATLFYKPFKSISKPSFWVEHIPNDVWIVFPYERGASVIEQNKHKKVSV